MLLDSEADTSGKQFDEGKDRQVRRWQYYQIKKDWRIAEPADACTGSVNFIF